VRRVVSAALFFALLASLTAGGISRAQKVETLVHWQHFHEARAAALRALQTVYQQRNPAVTIQTDLPPLAQYFDKLLTALATGSGPDVFQVRAEWMPILINGGFVASAPDWVVREAGASDFFDWTLIPFRRGGRYYGFPTDVQHLVMYINNSLAREAGLDPARPPQTWEELISQAQRATKRDAQGNILQAGLDTRYKWAVYSSLLYQHVFPNVVDPSKKRAEWGGPQGLQAWKIVERLVRGPEAVDSPRFLPGQRKWEAKKAVFYINHPVNRGVIQQLAPDISYTIAPIPKAGKDLVVPARFWAYVVNARSRNQDAAWRWVLFLTSPVGVRTWMKEAGDLPWRRSLLGYEPNPVVRDTLKFVRPVDYIGNCDAIRDDLFDAVALTATPLEQLVAQAAARETRCIEEALK
jgi:multiple sugar transport system substrate-binding protein